VSLDGLLARLAGMEPAAAPFVSLYVSVLPDPTGHRRHETFVRKELQSRIDRYAPRSLERDSLERDSERIREYLAHQLRPGTRTVAIFASAGSAGLFEAVPLDMSLDGHQLFVSERPHVHTLAWLNERHRPFAVLLADSHTARLSVFEAGARLVDRQLTFPKLRRSAGGGWAQARYQRHLEHLQLRRAKAAVDALERVVLEDRVERIVLAGDEVMLPVIRGHLPKPLEARVIGALPLDIRASEAEILRVGLDAVRDWDAREHAQKVARVLDAHRAHGLGVVGIRATRAALDRGQVDDLLLTVPPEQLPPGATEGARIAETLVRKALTTSAHLTFVEDATLLGTVEGVAALLRYAA
jgi:peptide chain release factor subunit 1